MIQRVHPLAKLLGSMIVALTLLSSIDWVSATVAIVAVAAVVGFAGIPPLTLLLRISPLLVAAPLSGLTTLLYGIPSGQTYWQWGLIHISDGSIELAIATALRVLAIGVPAVVLFITIDPTDLADGLAQIMRLPARFVIGALAAMRLMELFLEDWRAIGRARRARGLGDVGRVRRFLSQAFSMLVVSLRRASKLAIAMDARGFGAHPTRSWARESRFAVRDWAFLIGAVVVAALTVIIGLWAGTWHFVLSGRGVTA